MKRFLRLAACLPLFLSVSFSLEAQAGDTLATIRSKQSITLAHRETSIPFSYFDENKKPIGYSVDLCLKLVEAVKRELKLPKLEVVWPPVTPSHAHGGDEWQQYP